MISTDENALICDFAQTYHILDYKELRPKLAAILACGLPNDSRIKMKLRKEKYSADTLLLAAITDRLTLMLWQRSADGAKGINRPEGILEKLTEKETTGYEEYDSIEAYEAARAKIIEN